MSIVFLPPSSGSASIADATETTAGKIRIATSGEATTGTSDVIAMTPLTVKERIDAALVGGVEYKGIFNVASAAPDLSNGQKGDMYIISGSGSLYGKAWISGDHLLINEDMGGSISNSKIDKVDNTDQVTSVNAQTGAVSLSGNNLDGDHTASNYSTTSDKIEKHLEGIDNKFGTLGTASTKDTGVANGDVIVADATGLPVIDGSQLTNVTATDATKLAIASNLSDLNNAGTARTNLGVAIGSDVQAHDAGLDSISGLTTAADKMIYTTASDTYAVADLTSAGRALLDDADAAAQQATLGLGTAATQDTGTSANNVVQLDGSSRLPAVDGSQLTGITATDSTKLAIASNLSDLNNAGTARTNLGVAIGSDVQAHDAGLDSISGLTTAADKMIYTTASDTYAVTDLTSAGRALLDDADAAAQQATLGLGTAATQDTGTSANNVVQLDGSSRLPAVDGSLLTGITATDATKLAIASNLSDLNNAGTARTNLGVAIGSDVQAHDAGLDSIAGLTTAADKMIYTTASDTYAVADLTSAGRALLDDADAAAQRTTLGLVIGTDVAAIASPAFTGSPTATTQAQSDNSTKVATTAYVDIAVAAGGGGSSWTYEAKTTSFVAAADYHYSCTNSITATLPAASSNANKEIRIKNMGTDTVTIGRNGSDKIDGVASDYSMTVQYSSITLFSNGSDGWEII